MIPDADNLEDWHEQERIIRRVRRKYIARSSLMAIPPLGAVALWILAGLLPEEGPSGAAAGLVIGGILLMGAELVWLIHWAEYSDWESDAREQIKKAAEYKKLLEKAIE